jgi:hypothetical protein
MNPATIAAVLQILTAALQLAPLAVETIAGIKALLAADPAVPEELSKILAGTADDNAATLALIQSWRNAHPI